MRGYLRRQPHQPLAPGSIPAYAGLPSNALRNSQADRVYPRVCGVTTAIQDAIDFAEGLSPRMRGYLVELRAEGMEPGSIPAYAGLPSDTKRKGADSRVYPRVCGVTCRRGAERRPNRGLSPRMRGYPTPLVVRPTASGSIPAYAGLPGDLRDPQTLFKVYPRVCGVTPATICQRTGFLGDYRAELPEIPAILSVVPLRKVEMLKHAAP